MALTESLMAELGKQAPSFELPITNPGVDDLHGGVRSLDDYEDAQAVVVIFMCNHCPYVKHIEDALVDVASAYQAKGVRFIGISANDAEKYPADSFERMTDRAKEKGFPFPYLYDETQEVARDYGALCTPDFFVHDENRALVYRGRFDETRPDQGDAHGGDLSQALDELLDHGSVEMEQHPSMGCNIKWKPGKEPQSA